MKMWAEYPWKKRNRVRQEEPVCDGPETESVIQNKERITQVFNLGFAHKGKRHTLLYDLNNLNVTRGIAKMTKLKSQM